MSPAEFLDLLVRFAERPIPALAGRHVYLWHGDAERLVAALPGSAVRRLDLHALAAALPQAPRSAEAARRLLIQALRSQLGGLYALDRQQILVVTGCDLLSRYGVALTPFFEVASERLAIVLAIVPDETRFQPAEPLPDYVSLDARAPFNYLRAILGDGVTIGSVEELP
jgi:hypothetical protein